MDEEYERHFVHGERPIALADLDFIEASAVAQPFLDGIGPAGIECAAHRDARELQHGFVRERGVAVDAHLGDRFLRRRLRLLETWPFRPGIRRTRHVRAAHDDQRRCRGDHCCTFFGTVIFEDTSALR